MNDTDIQTITIRLSPRARAFLQALVVDDEEVQKAMVGDEQTPPEPSRDRIAAAALEAGLRAALHGATCGPGELYGGLVDLGSARTPPRAMSLRSGELPLWRVGIRASGRASGQEYLLRERDPSAAGAAVAHRHLPGAERIHEVIVGAGVVQVWQRGAETWSVTVEPGVLPPHDPRHR